MKFRRGVRRDAEINLAPLIDIVFLLLCFFVVGTTLTKETHLGLDLPTAATGQPNPAQDVLEVLVTAEGAFSVNGRAVNGAQPEVLKAALAAVAGDDREQPVFITADGRAPHRAVIAAMDVAGQLGFTRLSLTTREADATTTE